MSRFHRNNNPMRTSELLSDGEVLAITDEDDDAKTSVSASVRTVTSCDTLTQRLLNPKYYSMEFTRNLINKSSHGYDVKTAAQKVKSVTSNIDAVSFQDPKKLAGQGEKVTDAQVGRCLFESLTNMIVQGGEVFVAIVQTNFDLSEYIRGLRQEMSEAEESIRSIEMSIEEPVAINLTILEMKLEVKISEMEQKLHEHYFGEFLKRTNQVTVPQVSKLRSHTRRQEAVTAAESSAEESVEKWEDSVEQRQFDEDFIKFSHDATLQHKKSCIALHEAWERSRETKEKSQRQVTKFQAELVRKQVLEVLASEFTIQMNHIVQKLKTQLGPYTFIREKLAQNVVINDVSVLQPLATDNLSGIFHILLKEYSQASLGFFCEYLISLLSETATNEEANTNPDAVVRKMDKHLKTWLQMDLDAYNTKDHLFTVSLLKAYPLGSKIRSEGVLKVLEFAHKLERDPDQSTTADEYPDMPIYNELVRVIRTYTKSLAYGATTKSRTLTGGDTKITQDKDKVLETAAVASNEQTTSTGQTLVRGVHDREVTRKDGLMTADGKFTYVAHLKAGGPTSSQAARHQCRKCKYFGHFDNQCHQKPLRVDRPDGGLGSA